MSILKATLKYLAINPRFWVENRRLYARTSRLIQLLNLFSCSKEIVVDRISRIVTIRKKRFWFLSRVSSIPFNKIESIDYSLGTGSLGWNLMTFTGQVERFTISLCLADTDKKVKLFSFIGGEGVGLTTISGVDFPGLGNFRGDHENASWHFLKLLQDFTGKTWP